MNAQHHVIKIGGSLLTGNAPAERLRAWWESRFDAKNVRPVLIVGGGVLVDKLRRLDAAAPLGDELAHWLAVDLMSVNAQVVAAWLDLPVIVGGIDGLSAAGSAVVSGAVVFDPRRFLRQEEPSVAGPRLPIGWATTSDSIAARVAGVLGAELTLLKSSPPPSSCESDDWAGLAACGYVDAAFPSLAGSLSSVSFASPPAFASSGEAF